MTTYLFSQLILNWYHKHGRKNLPWQKDKTLYLVWISEIMLQQTTVKYVIPYFKRFITYFPNIQSLNNSNLDSILHLWSGLGYYKRAENIYKTAQIINNKYHKIFPDQFKDLIQLPGIGKSTAGAILSLTLNFCFSILDGNVKRILIRYYGIIGLTRTKKTENKLWKIIELITPLHNTGKFNQAMMDIGAIICLRIQPKCKICPLNHACIAYKKQEWHKYSIKTYQSKKTKKESWFILVNYQSFFWLKKNTTNNIWKNLFCFPNFSTKELALTWIKKKYIYSKNCETMIPFFHHFSHFTLKIHPILIRLSSKTNDFKDSKTKLWYNLQQPQNIGLPQPIKKILTRFKKNI
ncbi:MAG: A/G-specific adenine glycosylase [Buchnera aphidicola (Pentalonia nigronervosa)]|jgi:A/G-specific adenine glycosylase|uniref:Adenine DNA glycosylase n=1 Tax=Buchnera aphidicola (Pentalonia nigronervosa) TaxID=1309793 RepID=A0A7H1AZ18_9GAMM|nr:MAG: A/G-specific adenine glycosylase [Buchnera aphidicola (Pentalonia nigronervosa)]